MRTKKSGAVLFLFLLGGVQAFAKVTVPEHAGTLVVTFPNGEIKLIDKGETLPDIPTQSKLEILDGTISIGSEDGDSVIAACLRHEANVAGGASAKVTCTPGASQIEAVNGIVVVMDPMGKQTSLDAKDPANNIYKIQDQGTLTAKEKEPAPPTEAGDIPGSTPASGIVGDTTPVDSRSIQSSPGQ